MKRIGLDVGSTTIKCVVLDENNSILYSMYERHFSHVVEKSREILLRVRDEWVPEGEKREGVRSDEKEDIINAFGLSKMRDEHGTISTKAGFKSGTKIRAVESGTSYMRKHPVVRQAVNTAKPLAEKAMERKFREETQDIMK